MKKISVISIVSALSLLPGLLRGEEKAEAVPPMSDHPKWVLNPAFFSKDYEKLTLVGSLGETDDATWNHWKKNTAKIPHRDKVKTIFLNHGYLSEASLSYLSGFENVESLTLGINIEGVTISPEALKQLAGFRKLHYLHIAIHGLDDPHLKAIRESCGNLKVFNIQFASVLMIQPYKEQMDRWKAVSLDDGAAREIARIQSLEALTIDSVTEPDGKVRFSEAALQALLKLPHLESLQIHSGCFTDDARKAIKQLTLPPFVKIPGE